MSADVRAFYLALGIELPDRPGANLSIRCFADPGAHRHDDKAPSASVNLDHGAYRCHGCGAQGGPYDAALAAGRTPGDAMELLRRHGLVEEDRRNGQAKAEARPQGKAPYSEVELERWHAALRDNEPALARLRELRGWSPTAVCELGLGLDGRRVVFPVRDGAGTLAGMVRYSPDPATRNGAPKSKADPGTRRDLFPAPETVEGEELWLVEGEPDAVAARTLGLAGVAVPGTNGWRAEWAERIAGRRVHLALDCDAPGRQAAERIAADLAPHAEVRVLDLNPAREDGYDLGDLLREAAEHGADGLLDLRRVLERMAASAPGRAAEDTEPTTSDLLSALAPFIRRYVVMSEAQADVVALWILHTHVIEAADATPYVAITSAEPRSGKSRLLEVLEQLVRAPLATSNISDAALFRSIAQEAPTLLFDEIDAIFGPKARDREDLRGMVNAGHRRGAEVRRCGGPNRDKLEVFPVFCAKAFAGIGDLPLTVADRCIPVRLERRAPAEKVERGRAKALKAAAEPLRERAARWAAASVDALEHAEPELPGALDDRAQDGAEPLLAIADLAGGEWPARARAAVVELHGARQAEESSLGVRLLADIRAAFDATGDKAFSTAGLLELLVAEEESPWVDWRGKPLTPKALAGLLRPYRLRSRSVRLPDGSTPKGFQREQFEDAFNRYLPRNPASSRHTATTRMGSGSEPDSLPPQGSVVADGSEAANPHGKRDVAGVAGESAVAA